jgi:hypothetical protein
MATRHLFDLESYANRTCPSDLMEEPFGSTKQLRDPQVEVVVVAAASVAVEVTTRGNLSLGIPWVSNGVLRVAHHQWVTDPVSGLNAAQVYHC